MTTMIIDFLEKRKESEELLALFDYLRNSDSKIDWDTANIVSIPYHMFLENSWIKTHKAETRTSASITITHLQSRILVRPELIKAMRDQIQPFIDSGGDNLERPASARSQKKEASKRLKKGFFLGGCFGSGKSNLMLLFTVYLQLKYSNVRTVLFGDCATWAGFEGSFGPLEVFFEGIVWALADHEKIVKIVDQFKDNHGPNPRGLHEGMMSAITQIKDYCMENGLKVVLLYDNIDKLANTTKFFERLTYKAIMAIKRCSSFYSVFSSFDENTAESIRWRFTSTRLYIPSSYSRDEGKAYISTMCPKLKFDSPMVDECIKSTWLHPNELRRLCRALENVSSEIEFYRTSQIFRENDEFSLNPRPYSTHKENERDILLTVFHAYFSFPYKTPIIDWNYIDMSKKINGVQRFSCSRVADLVLCEKLGEERNVFERTALLLGDSEEEKRQLVVAAIRWALGKKGELVQNTLRIRQMLPESPTLRLLDTEIERLRAESLDELIEKIIESNARTDMTTTTAYYCITPDVSGAIDYIVYDESSFPPLMFISCMMLSPLKLKVELQKLNIEHAVYIRDRLSPGLANIDYYIICGSKAASFVSRRLPTKYEVGCRVHIVDINSLRWIGNLEVYQFR